MRHRDTPMCGFFLAERRVHGSGRGVAGAVRAAGGRGHRQRPSAGRRAARPGRPIERLAEVVTCRRGDGREAKLADLRSAERVRAEEVELSVPDGRSVRTLLDAGGVTTYDSLLRLVWAEHAASSAHPVRTAVKKLRCKLGDQAKKPTYIFTERGVGYRMPASGGPSIRSSSGEAEAVAGPRRIRIRGSKDLRCGRWATRPLDIDRAGDPRRVGYGSTCW